MKEFIVSKDFNDTRLDRFVQKACRDIPKGAIQKLLRKGEIKINGKKAPAEAKIKEGDVIRVYAKTDDFKLKVARGLPKLKVIYEDENIVAINKEPYLPVQLGQDIVDCVTERLKNYLRKEIEASNGLFIPGVVGRLDTNTSGIVLAGKTPDATRHLEELNRDSKIEKIYVALVKGTFPKSLKATHYAIKNVIDNKMILSETEKEGSVKMVTAFECIDSVNGYSLVRAKLITGKTHQIRSQLAFLDFPIIGDAKYGDRITNQRTYTECGLNRQFLHAYEVKFNLWYDIGDVRIRCEIPKDLKDCLNLFEMAL